MRNEALLVLFLSATSLAACGQDSKIITTTSSTYTSKDVLVMQASGRPEVKIEPSGDLLIADTKADLSATQRNLLQEYYVTVQMMNGPKHVSDVKDARVNENGTSNIAVTVSQSKQSNASRGNPRSTTVKGKSHAKIVCDGLEKLRESQELAIRNIIPALKPYLPSAETQSGNCMSKWG